MSPVRACPRVLSCTCCTYPSRVASLCLPYSQLDPLSLGCCRFQKHRRSQSSRIRSSQLTARRVLLLAPASHLFCKQRLKAPLVGLVCCRQYRQLLICDTSWVSCALFASLFLRPQEFLGRLGISLSQAHALRRTDDRQNQEAVSLVGFALPRKALRHTQHLPFVAILCSLFPPTTHAAPPPPAPRNNG